MLFTSRMVPQGKGECMRILGFADRRQQRVAGPLSAIEQSAGTVSISDRPNSLGKYLSLFWRGRKEINSHEPDVLLSNHPGRLGFGVVLLGIAYDIPVVIKVGGDLWQTNHDKFSEKLLDGEYLRALARLGLMLLNHFVCSLAAGFIVVSNELQDTVIKNTERPEEEVQVVHTPVQYERYASGDLEAGQRLVEVEDQIVILSVTNLSYEGKFEGIRETLCEIIPLLRQHEAAYIVAGDGRYLDSLREYLNEEVSSDVRDQIHTPGFVDSVESLYSMADIFVYISNIDGYPSVISEAQAAGLPIVANAAHGIVEQIDHEETGLLVDPSCSGDLRKSVRLLLNEPSMREELGKRAQNVVRDRNSPETIGRQMVKSIERIIRA